MFFKESLDMDELKIIKSPNKIKSKGVGKNVRLVERDYEILRFILEMGAASSDVVWIGFFKEEGIGKKYAQNRLSRLRKSDYLISHFTPDGAARWYTATKKAKSFVSSYFELGDCDLPEVRKNIAQGNFFHDKGMCLIRAMLKSKGEIVEGSFLSDYLLKSQIAEGEYEISERSLGYGVPDGVYESKDGIRVALEFERNTKSHKNILKKFRNAENFEGSDCVLFIFASENVRKVYLNQLSKLNIYKKPFVFMTYDEFIYEYERDFNEFSLLNYVPSFVVEQVEGALSLDGYLRESQVGWGKFLKGDDIRFLDYQEIERLESRKKSEKREREYVLRSNEKDYRQKRNNYIAWKSKSVLSRVLDTEPLKLEPVISLDKEDGVVGWWQ
jgi:hypothetical protein